MLLDQRIVAGLGNIYVCEALHMARILPGRAAGRISRPRLDRLAAAIKAVLLDAIGAGGSSLRDYVQPNGELGYFSAQWRVYGRESRPCLSGGADRRRTDSGTLDLLLSGVPANLTRSGPVPRWPASSGCGRTAPFHFKFRGSQMANTPQAKKRIRRNARRTEINGARVSRIRTFVKQAEAAIAAGDKDRARGPQGSSRSWRAASPRCAAQEYGVPETVEADAASHALG